MITLLKACQDDVQTDRLERRNRVNDNKDDNARGFFVVFVNMYYVDDGLSKSCIYTSIGTLDERE